MHEYLGGEQAEFFWQEARKNGLGVFLREKNMQRSDQVGRALECLGHAFVSSLFPKLLITNPRQTFRLQELIDPRQDRVYRPRFPDGLMLQDLGQNSFALRGFIEYKMADIKFADKMHGQLSGFYSLHDLLAYRNAYFGREIIDRFLGRRLTSLQVEPEMPFYYVVPQDRTVSHVRQVLADWDRVKELKFPMTAGEIKARLFS